MATATQKRLVGPAQPGTGDSTPYTCSSAGGAVVKEIIIANSDTVNAQTVSIAINGTAATAANCILAAVSVPAGTTLVYALSTVLVNTDTIHYLQGVASKITVCISGIEYS